MINRLLNFQQCILHNARKLWQLIIYHGLGSVIIMY